MANGSVPRQDSSGLEAKVVMELSRLLERVAVGQEFQIEPAATLSFSLELFLPQLLSQKYPVWSGETLDGIFIVCAQKIDAGAAHLAGMCMLMSDQTVTPFSLHVVLDPSHTKIASYRVHLGEPGGGRLGISGPTCHSDRAQILQYAPRDRLKSIIRSYKVAGAYGDGQWFFW